MKKTLLILGMLILFSSVVFSETVDRSTVTVTQDGSTVKVYYKSDVESAKVSIRSASGKLLFSEIIKIKSGFIRPYDLGSLRAGNYVITVEDKNGRTVKDITIRKPEAVLQAAIVKLRNEKMVAVTMYGKNNAMAKVTILNAQNRVIHTDQVRVNKQVVQVYDLSNISGTATIRVEGNGEKVSKEIE